MEAETKKLHDLDVDAYLAECVRIEPLALEEEFVRVPADLAYWNERYARANKAFLIAKIDRERVKARLTILERERLVAEKGDKKGPTVGEVDASVENHADMQAARDAELNAEIEKARLYGVLDAVRAKKEMLISLGAQVRAEMAGDPVLRDQMRGSRLARDGGL